MDEDASARNLAKQFEVAVGAAPDQPNQTAAPLAEATFDHCPPAEELRSTSPAAKRDVDEVRKSPARLDTKSMGHTLRPAQQGQRVLVSGDGWGGGGTSKYEAIVTEADDFTFTVVAVAGSWAETHVLQKHCVAVQGESASASEGMSAETRHVAMSPVLAQPPPLEISEEADNEVGEEVRAGSRRKCAAKSSDAQKKRKATSGKVNSPSASTPAGQSRPQSRPVARPLAQHITSRKKA